MSFNYHQFIQEEREKSHSDNDIERYEALIGPLGLRPMKNSIDPCDKTEVLLTGEVWYRVLVRPFSPFTPFLVPQHLKNEFDWPLFSQLAAASFATDIKLERHTQACGIKVVRLQLNTEAKGSSISKFVDDISKKQILTLFEIWVREQIGLYTLWRDERIEMIAILKSSQKCLNNWNKQIRFINRFKDQSIH